MTGTTRAAQQPVSDSFISEAELATYPPPALPSCEGSRQTKTKIYIVISHHNQQSSLFFICFLLLLQENFRNQSLSPPFSSPFFFPSRLVIFALPPARSIFIRNSDQPLGHSGHASPLPATVRAFKFYRGKSPAVSSLIDSRQIVRTYPSRFLQANFSFAQERPTQLISNSRNRPS